MWWPTLILSLSLCVHDLSLSVCCFFPFSNIYKRSLSLSLSLSLSISFIERPKRFQIRETICFCFFVFLVIILFCWGNFLSTRRLQPQSIGKKKRVCLCVCVRVSRSTIHPRKKKKRVGRKLNTHFDT
jgi:hypothetical protein